MSDGILQKQLDYYKAHQNELVVAHEGKFLVIKDSEVQGAYDTQIEAYNSAKSRFELGTFLIQQALPGKESYTQTFHSRAVFN